MPTPVRFKTHGFTLVEILITMSISAILIALVTTNYHRANQDSELQREASFLVSRLRLVQESTAGGLAIPFCQNKVKQTCSSDCGPVDGACITAPPEGGNALFFATNGSSGTVASSTQYAWYADRDCSGAPTQVCVATTSGQIITPNPAKDTLQSTYALGTAFVVAGLRVQNSSQTDTNLTKALVRYKAPDGRQVQIADNSTATVWDSFSVMLKLNIRNTDCRVVSITSSNVITQTVDADCNLAT